MPRRRIQAKLANSGLNTSLWKSLQALNCRPFNIVMGINFLVMIIYYLLFVTGPAYIMATYKTSLSTAGFSSGLLVLGCLAGRFISGNLMQVLGKNLLLYIGLALTGISIYLFVYAQTPLAIFADRALTGIGVGLAGTVTATVVALVVPNQIKAFGISVFSLGTALSLALGPFFGIILTKYIEYPLLCKWLSAVILAALLPAMFLRAEQGGSKHHARPFFSLNSYIDPRVARFSLVPMIVFLGYGCMQAFMASYADELNISDYASVFFIIYAIMVIGTRPFMGRLIDSRSENAAIYPILIVVALGLAILGLTKSGWMLLLAAAFLGFGYGNYQSVGQAVSVMLVTPSRYSQATSTFFIFMDLGIGLGPYVFGLIAPKVGYSGMYLILALIVLLSLLPYYFLHGRNAARKFCA